MSKRRLLVEVDCGKRRCKTCEHVSFDVSAVDYPRCAAFDAPLDDCNNKLLRLPACHKAEEEAKRGECPVDDETLDAWDVLAKQSAEHSIVGSVAARCGRSLATAVEALRQLRAPGNLPRASTVESAEPQWTSPIVFTFEGKVKP